MWDSERNGSPEPGLPRERRLRFHRVQPEGLHTGRPSAAVIIDVVVKDVDFPERADRVGDPDLRLSRVTALVAVFSVGAKSGRFEATLNLDQFLGISHAQPHVIDVAARAGPAWNQRQYQRRLGQVELGVVRSDLGRFGAKERAVERNGAVKFRDAERY